MVTGGTGFLVLKLEGGLVVVAEDTVEELEPWLSWTSCPSYLSCYAA